MAYEYTPYTPQFTPEAIDPNLFKRRAAGVAAQNELSNLLRGEQMQEAMANKYRQLPGVQGEGFAATAPNAFQVLATALARGRGNKQMKDLRAQADVLRGNIKDASIAEYEMQEANRLRNLKQQQEIQAMASHERKQREEADKWQLRENFQPWINDQGDIKYLASSRGRGMLNESLDQEKDLEGYKRLGKSSALRGIGSKPDQRTAAKAFTTLRNLDDIRSATADLTEEDLALINRPVLNVALGLVPGVDIETYVRNQKIDLTPRAKRWLSKMQLVDANLRHDLFGAALTRLEAGKAAGFLPGAAGLLVSDSLGRIHNVAETNYQVLGGIEDSNLGMTPGTLTNKIRYEFTPEFLEKQNSRGGNSDSKKVNTSTLITDEEMNLSEDELKDLIEKEMASLRGENNEP